MNALGEILVAISLLVGCGYAMDKIYITVKREALIHAHRGLPSLSAYTSKLTCSKIDSSGRLVPVPCSGR